MVLEVRRGNGIGGEGGGVVMVLVVRGEVW